MEEREIRVEVTDKVATLYIDRPQARNAMTSRTTGQIRDALLELKKRDDVNCIVIRGAGDIAFCAGHDLKQLSVAAIQQGSDPNDMQNTADVVEALFTLPQPTIAAVKGYVRGGGNWLAASCDLVVACEDATFSVTNILHRSFPLLRTIPMIRRIGRSRTMRMVLTAEVLDARQAEAIGLVDVVYPVEGYWDRVREFANLIASRPPAAVRAGKEALRLYMDMDDAKAVRMLLTNELLRVKTRDPQEYHDSVEKRIAEYKGAGAPG